MTEILTILTLLLCLTIIIVVLLLIAYGIFINIYVSHKVTVLPFERLKPYAYCLTIINKETIQSKVAEVFKGLPKMPSFGNNSQSHNKEIPND